MSGKVQATEFIRRQFQHGTAFGQSDLCEEEFAVGYPSHREFGYAATAIVLDPEFDRTHFHLIYLTRNAKGIEVFKEAEKKAMEVQEAGRAEAQQRRRVSKNGQTE